MPAAGVGGVWPLGQGPTRARSPGKPRSKPFYNIPYRVGAALRGYRSGGTHCSHCSRRFLVLCNLSIPVFACATPIQTNYTMSHMQAARYTPSWYFRLANANVNVHSVTAPVRGTSARTQHMDAYPSARVHGAPLSTSHASTLLCISQAWHLSKASTGKGEPDYGLFAGYTIHPRGFARSWGIHRSGNMHSEGTMRRGGSGLGCMRFAWILLGSDQVCRQLPCDRTKGACPTSAMLTRFAADFLFQGLYYNLCAGLDGAVSNAATCAGGPWVMHSALILALHFPYVGPSISIIASQVSTTYASMQECACSFWHGRWPDAAGGGCQCCAWFVWCCTRIGTLCLMPYECSCAYCSHRRKQHQDTRCFLLA